jgi:hypothetical protein
MIIFGFYGRAWFLFSGGNMVILGMVYFVY